jgi:hypothetical protein
MQFIDKIVRAIKAILPWSLTLKLVLSALISILSGAGLLAYLSEYATYWYALYFGLRPPLEGIPYLKAAVALGSVLLLLLAALVFLFSVVALRLALEYVEEAFLGSRDVTTVALTAIRRRPGWQLFLGALLVGIAAGVASYLAKPDKPHEPFVMGGYFFLVALVVAYPRSISWVAGAATVASLIACIVLLFTPAQYSRFLRIVGYGGGLPVTVELEGESIDSSQAGNELYLMLRTTDSFILLQTKPAEQIIEIPRERVRRLIHNAGGLYRLPYKLPEPTR